MSLSLRTTIHHLLAEASNPSTLPTTEQPSLGTPSPSQSARAYRNTTPTTPTTPTTTTMSSTTTAAASAILRASSPAPRALRVSTTPLSVVISNTVTPRQQQRSFSNASRLRLKEDAAERSGEEADAAKQAQLQKQRDGKGHWHEELASNSEVNVKADQEGGRVADHGKHMRELQELGKEKGEKGEL